MDWGFLDIFKKAEFNTLMLSVAITGWILYFFFSRNVYISGAAILSSAYCVIRLIVYAYHYFSLKCQKKKYDAQMKKEKEDKKEERMRKRNIEISRMFEGLKDENKKHLAFVILRGKTDSFHSNVLHFNPFSDDFSYVYSAVNISKIFRDAYGQGDDCIWISHYTDTLAATIDPFLYNLIKQYIEKTGLEFKNQ